MRPLGETVRKSECGTEIDFPPGRIILKGTNGEACHIFLSCVAVMIWRLHGRRSLASAALHSAPRVAELLFGADLPAEGLLGDSEECAALIGERDLELADAGAQGGVLRGVHEWDVGAGVALDGLAEESQSTPARSLLGQDLARYRCTFQRVSGWRLMSSEFAWKPQA